MLILSISLALFIAAVFGFFVLAYTRVIGSHHEVFKATEAAAIAAAKSMSQVVIEDPNLGFIGITDSAPLGAQTNANDGFGTPVIGINTLLARTRLDLIIADQLNDDTFRALAVRDYNNVMAAKDRLNTELGRLTQAGATGVTKDGRSISPYADAQAAYEANQIRMTGEANNLVGGSLNLSLGLISDLPTNTHIPQPSNYSAIQESDQEAGKYLAYRNIAYNGRNFVFAGVGSSTALVDHKQFRATDASLPYAIPTIVRLEVQQHFSGTNLTGEQRDRTLKSVAAARPGALEDNHPNPGGMVFVFDDGPIANFTMPAQLFFNPQFDTSPVDLFETANSGDFPTNARARFSHPITGERYPMVTDVFSLALYDWVKRAGSRANVESLRDFFTTNFQVGTGDDLHSFQWRADGTIDYQIMPASGTVHYPLSDKQWRAVSGLAFSDRSDPTSVNSKVFDCFVNDYVYQPGRIRGGRHAGQPLNISSTTSPVFYDSGVVGSNTLYSSKWFAAFPTGPGNGALRTSYREPNMAVVIRLHFRR